MPGLDDNLHAMGFYYAARYSNIIAFVQNLGHFEIMRLAALDDEMRATLLDNIASLILRIVYGFLNALRFRISITTATTTPHHQRILLIWSSSRDATSRCLSSSKRSDFTLRGSQTTSKRSVPNFGRSALLIAPTNHCSRQSMPATTRVQSTAHRLNRVYAAASARLSALWAV